jgi:hypothetical protein
MTAAHKKAGSHPASNITGNEGFVFFIEWSLEILFHLLYDMLFIAQFLLKASQLFHRLVYHAIETCLQVLILPLGFEIEMVRYNPNFRLIAKLLMIEHNIDFLDPRKELYQLLHLIGYDLFHVIREIQVSSGNFNFHKTSLSIKESCVIISYSS